MFLENERIYLRPLCGQDATALLEMTTDEEIRYMTGTKAVFTLDQIKRHIDNCANDQTRQDFAICSKEDHSLLGELSILDIDEEDLKAGFRISMRSVQLTGKGYGTEAIQLVLRYVFNHLRLNRLQLEVFAHNARGIRAYEKTGFQREGVLRQSLKYNGQYVDEIIMAILKQDYDKANFL
ncbi:aminoglycoside N(6')-acetyltransferase [Sporosarcina sp. NCCP-2222]|uniref:GNAT family N-acetyltransferase n=1 Tax=Sporosarcina sp. NCCP-2222 TaxID=2935073 RepID=UPI00208103D8|nr:GNAT family protein [Sporosarcina sp. NCCP-2222]GKV56455.1 aminoglycoside N(6')-acetyltransferase [Sporosarcina sp. NCCP-2222]